MPTLELFHHLPQPHFPLVEKNQEMVEKIRRLLDRSLPFLRGGQNHFNGFFPHLLGDIPGQRSSFEVVQVVWFHHDSDFPARLDGVRLGDALESLGDSLQLLEALDVAVERFAAGAGAGAAV